MVQQTRAHEIHKESPNHSEFSRWDERFRIITSVVVVASICGFALVTLMASVLVGAYGYWDEHIHKHFAAVVGLPMAAAAALFIVMVLKVANGPIEFEGLGFKFRGASGPVILWVFCFLAIVASIKILW